MNQSILKVCYIFALLTSLISCGRQGPAGPAGAPAVQGLATGTYIQCLDGTVTLSITNNTGHPLSYYAGDDVNSNTSLSCELSNGGLGEGIKFEACNSALSPQLYLNGTAIACGPLALVTFMPGISYISVTPSVSPSCPTSPGFASCTALLVTDQNIMTEIDWYQSF